MAIQVQLRRGTATQNNAFTGAIGELSFDTTAKQVRIHDGSTAGGFKIGVGNFPTGTNNVVLGNTALDSLDGSSPGGSNTAVGHDALTANTTASNNVAIGKDALKTNTTAASSTAVGTSALAVSTGTLNTAFGKDAGSLISSGTKNTILGSFDGNQGGLDIRTSDSHIVLSDGDGNPRLIIDDSGNVDIGGETTELKLKNTTHEDTDGGRESKITFQGEQSGGEQSVLAQIQASHDATADDQKGDLIFRTNDGSDGTSPTEAMRIQSDQSILAGSPTTDDDQTFQVIKTGASSTVGIHSNRAAAGGSALILSHNRNTSVGSFTKLNDNDTLGRITFQGCDGGDIKTEGAQIHAEINGTTSANDLPTELVFSTTPDGASSISERVRITRDGAVGIGTAAPLRQLSIASTSNAEMSFISGTSSNASILFGDGLTGLDVYRGYIQYEHNNNAMTFATNAAEGMRLKDGGNLEKTGDTNSARIIPQSDNAGFLGENSHRWEALFAVNGTIQTSDKTMKTEITNSALGLDFVKALRPVSYKWISGGKHFEYDEDDLTKSNPTITDVAGKRNHYGLIAQEVKETLGDTDFGGWVSEDVTDENAKQSLRYDQFISPLIKAVQELSAEVETLKTKVAALEAE